MTMAGAISIVIPVFNGEAFLAEAIDSILRQADQVLEIIIVDDGSTDRTPVIAQSFGPPIKYVRQDNQGPAAARNHGVRLAKSEIIGFLDADDLWCAGMLAEQLAVLAAKPECDVVKGLTQFIHELPGDDGMLSYQPKGEPLIFWNLSGTLYRRNVFERVGLLNEAMRFGEDFDWVNRAREQGVGTEVLDRVVQLHRRHAGNMTRGRGFRDLNGFGIIRNAMLRRRRTAGEGDGQ
jgi:glycosyltransferase involved in cell wall biosynthesis